MSGIRLQHQKQRSWWQSEGGLHSRVFGEEGAHKGADADVDQVERILIDLVKELIFGCGQLVWSRVVSKDRGYISSYVPCEDPSRAK